MVKGSKHFQRQIFSTHENKQNFMYRCLKSRLGGNLGHQIVQGRWPQEKKGWHINCLEIEAVLLAVKNVLPQLVNQSVLIRSDNQSVVQHVNWQGGHGRSNYATKFGKYGSWQ